MMYRHPSPFSTTNALLTLHDCCWSSLLDNRAAWLLFACALSFPT
jgi:hypothetical protein